MTEFTGGPGFAAFIATFSMVLVTLVLMRSLNKQLRKVRTQPPADAAVMANTATSGIEEHNDDGDEVTGKARNS